MNNLVLVGRVSREAEIKYLDSGKAVCKFAVAVDHQGKRKGDEGRTDFFDCECWDKAAEFAGEWVKKGKPIAVSGRFESRKGTGNHEGKTFWTLKVDKMDPFIGGKPGNGGREEDDFGGF